MTGATPTREGSLAARLVIALVAVAAGGCDLGEAVDSARSFDPVVTVEAHPIVAAGLILDAETGRVVTAPVHLEFQGEAADLARNALGGPLSGISTTAGAASLAFSNAINPNPQRPVTMRIVATAPGYRPASVPLSLEARGPHEFRLLMVPQDRDLAPSSTGYAGVLVTDGRVASSATATATDLGTLTALVVAAEGIAATDAMGNPLEGSFDLTLTHSTPSPRLLALFPGGMNTGMELATGEVRRGTLTTGALIELVLKRNGEGVPARLDSLEISARLTRQLVSPRTNARVSPGDRVDVHEWLPERGRWRLAARAAVTGTAAEPEVLFRAGGTGVFSLGYQNAPCAAATLTLEESQAGPVSVTAWQGGAGSATGYRVWRFPSGSTRLTLTSPPAFWSGHLEVRTPGGWTRVAYGTLCGATVDIPAGGAGSQPSPLRLSPAGCDALRVTELPGLAVLIRGSRDVTGAVSLLSEAPWVRAVQVAARDRLGRPTSLSAEAGSVGGQADVHVVLGGESRIYQANPDPLQPSVDVTDFVMAAGICSGG